MNAFSAALRHLYPLACVFVPCLVYQAILYMRCAPREGLAGGNLMWRYVFIFYLFLVMWAVGMGSVWDIAAYGVDIKWSQINLIPFGKGITPTHPLNIVLFMPLGILLPLIWRRGRALPYTAVAGFALSLCIELGQLFNHRITDIDDVIMNTLGAVLGYAMWRAWSKRLRREPKEAGVFADSPRMYLTLTILGSFFLENWRWVVPMHW